MPGHVPPSGTRSPAIRRVKGIKEDTLNFWLAEIAPQMEQVEAALLRHHRLSRAQLDALWT